MNRQPGQEPELFPDLKPQGERSFIDTGWGRFPIALDDAGLDPFAFAIYCRISVMADRRQDPPDLATLAECCRMTAAEAKAAMDVLKARNFIVIDGDDWTLTDPKEWLR